MEACLAGEDRGERVWEGWMPGGTSVRWRLSNKSLGIGKPVQQESLNSY